MNLPVGLSQKRVELRPAALPKLEPTLAAIVLVLALVESLVFRYMTEPILSFRVSSRLWS
jgi:hypothetical protein